MPVTAVRWASARAGDGRREEGRARVHDGGELDEVSRRVVGVRVLGEDTARRRSRSIGIGVGGDVGAAEGARRGGRLSRRMSMEIAGRGVGRGGGGSASGARQVVAVVRSRRSGKSGVVDGGRSGGAEGRDGRGRRLAAEGRLGVTGREVEGGGVGSVRDGQRGVAVERRTGGERAAMIRNVCAVRLCQTGRGLGRSVVRSRGLMICGRHGQAVVTSHVRDVGRVGKRERLRIVSGSVGGSSNGSRRGRLKPRRRI